MGQIWKKRGTVMNRAEKGKYNREKAIELRTANPEMTLEAIGDLLHITKERVRQILVKEELPTVALGQSTTKIKESLPCMDCGSETKGFNTKHALYCSIECVKSARNKKWIQWRKDHPDRITTYQCAYCGQDKSIRTSVYNRQVRTFNNLYCSHHCSVKAQWADKNSNLRNNSRLLT